MALDFGNHIIKGQLIVVSKDANGNKIVRTVGPVDKDGNVIQKKKELINIKPKKKKANEDELKMLMRSDYLPPFK